MVSNCERSNCELGDTLAGPDATSSAAIEPDERTAR
jgi:hypothetical protein